MRHGDVDTWKAAANPNIEMIQRAGMYADQDFCRAGVWLGHVLEVKDFRSAVFVEYDRFHAETPAQLHSLRGITPGR
jgi:hypothetical protein